MLTGGVGGRPVDVTLAENMGLDTMLALNVLIAPFVFWFGGAAVARFVSSLSASGPSP